MSNSNPLISVVTVVFNGENHIERTIKSVINQKYDNVEYIVIDGGSVDGTVDIIKKYDKQIDFWISENDAGIYDAMNKGIKMSNGDFVNFMNASDEFSDEYVLDKVVSDIKSKPVWPDILIGYASIYSQDRRYITLLKPLRFSKLSLNIFNTRALCHQAIFVNKNKLLYYNADYKIRGDLNWYYDLLRNVNRKNILTVHKSVCNYHLGGVSNESIKNNYSEQIAITYKQNNIVIFILTLPFMLLPIIIKAKNILLSSFNIIKLNRL
jgi:glycosyltransferase involved in cell wall biosynthesis